MNNSLEYKDGVKISIIACDVDWANIRVQSNGKSAFCKVGVPDMARSNSGEWKSYDLSKQCFDSVIEEHRDDIIEKIHQLNQWDGGRL